MNKERLGAFIGERRRELGLTQRELAERLHVTNKAVSKWECGSAILLITADFDELFKLSDRIGVIYEGHIVTEGKSEEYTPNRLGLYMGGGTDEDQAV